MVTKACVFDWILFDKCETKTLKRRIWKNIAGRASLFHRFISFIIITT